MKYLFFLLLTLSFTTFFAQNNINTYIEEGIAYHDKGEYDKALATYEKALILDPQSTVVNYEMALSYFKKNDYKNTIARADMVLKKNEDNLVNAYLIKGSALDMMGEVKQSIKLFEKAMRKFPDDYLLPYNLALNHYKLNQMEEAKENVIKALENNPSHGSSHWMLANIESEQGNTVQSLLANYYFLFLEPNSSRSLDAYTMLQLNFSGNVTKGKDEAITINISMSDGDDPFSAAALMLGLMGASNMLPENADKTSEELFVENTNSFFQVLGELKKEKEKGLYWNFYVPFFYDLAKSNHLEAYCMYISQSGNENAEAWLNENSEKLKAFAAWLKM
ncbi:tetratricopeptide repeat protein [Aequorivita marisscotiae]|uniref:Tetratricopeptide repeat protein n=1 Tax=Aequorivita marisscotiae TaxID=3040348 RepID=A0ABY8KV64_9FLAO|nr:tetratricopeptide repeat protein [Aequorivita sp. Ant34-E75]WGF93314.1 tetratricopeptide repeat protein [Aequorivita sp. Ant34-E75]